MKSEYYWVLETCTENCNHKHCEKSDRIRSYSGPYFLSFRLNTERYSVCIHIQSKYGKIRTRITPNNDAFYAVKCHKQNSNVMMVLTDILIIRVHEDQQTWKHVGLSAYWIFIPVIISHMIKLIISYIAASGNISYTYFRVNTPPEKIKLLHILSSTAFNYFNL